MTYHEFTDNFILTLAKKYRNNEMPLHALVDIDLWRKVLPDNVSQDNNFHWYNIKLNAFMLEDELRSMLIVYSIPIFNRQNEIKFIGLRFDNNRKRLLYYSLRRPKYNDEAWEIFQYDFEHNEQVFINKIKGTDSLREFRNNIETISFREPSILNRILTHVIV